MVTKSEFLSQIEAYTIYLRDKERSENTILKYLLAIKNFEKFANEANDEKAVKNLMIAYKRHLENNYEISSANLYIIALNGYLKYLNKPDLCLQTFKEQSDQYTLENSLTMDEYEKMSAIAKKSQNNKIYFIMTAIAGTGIRISELQFLTVDALKSKGLHITNKGKSRYVPISQKLCDVLLNYCENNNIESGYVFYGRSSTKPINRTTISRQLKSIANKANVDESKAHPHSLRHLFAKRFMEVDGNIAVLKIILGHSDLKSTLIYTCPTNDEKRKSMDKLGFY